MRGELVKPDNRIEYNTGPRMRIAGAATFVACALLTLTACSGQPLSTREKGAAYGAVGGAATGAIIGAFTGNPGAGAAIGGGLGLLGGALIGNAMQNRENEQAQTQTQIQQQQREIQRQQYEIQALKNQQAG
jgi:uncharacterized protein YcfJ